ncbi:MAG: fused MFS/spermidine synthase, partial [Candidatus Eisenbacteria bacterium]|nr:fused MFS/spermidine synthase [Candidatus Eisenbacteria bacterium]
QDEREQALQLVIFLAGFSFLVYEVSWQRLLALVLGSTVTASTLVLAAFMAGLGAGAYAWSRAPGARRDARRLLGLLLAGVGGSSALGYGLVNQALPLVQTALAARGVAAGPAEAIVFALAACILLAPTFLMGGVFPLVAGLAVRSGDSIGRSLGRLYALETLGSALGGLAAGFILLGALGQRATLGLAVALDLALAAWLLARRGPAAAGPGREAPAAVPAASGGPGARAAALVAAFACGFCILALQVLWLRVLRIYLTNTSYTFALVSSLAILGAFAGSAYYARRGTGKADPVRALAVALLALAVSAGAGWLLLVRMPQILMFPFESLLADPMLRVLGIPLAASLLIVVPPAACSGFVFPLACRLVIADRARVGRGAGLVLMVNTAGAVLGPPAAAFLLLPALGAVRAALLLLVLIASAAFYALTRGGGRAPARMRAAAGAGAIALLALVLFLPSIRILPPSFIRLDREILFYRESVEGTLAVGRDRVPGGTKHTYVNNSAVIGSSYDAVKVVKMVGYLPYLLGLDCREVLVIGFGIGVTTSAIASLPAVESIECAELVAGLAEASVHYRDLNRDVAGDPRLRIIEGDGRHYLQRTGKRYDLISCDPTHPILGSGNLYTRDYFDLCRRRLNAGGMVSQYLPLHKLGPREFLGILSTFEAVFPHCAVWLGHSHAVLLGAPEPLRFDFPEWSRRAAALAGDERFHHDPYHLAATLMLTGEGIRALAPRGWIHSDDRSYTEFFAPRCLDPGNAAANLRLLIESRADPGALFSGVPEPERMARYVQGSRWLAETFFHLLSGDPRSAHQALRRAYQVNPEDRELPFLMQLHFPPAPRSGTGSATPGAGGARGG